MVALFLDLISFDEFTYYKRIIDIKQFGIYPWNFAFPVKPNSNQDEVNKNYVLESFHAR